MVNLFFYFLGIFVGWVLYGLYLDIRQDTSDLRVMRSKKPDYIKKYNKAQDEIDKNMKLQNKIERAIILEKKSKNLL